MFDYVENENGIILTSYNGNQRKVTVPNYIKNKKVIKIDSLCFFNNNKIRELHIKNIDTLSDNCIVDCLNLKYIYLENINNISMFMEACEKAQVIVNDIVLYKILYKDYNLINLCNFLYRYDAVKNGVILEKFILVNTLPINKIILPNYICGVKVIEISSDFFEDFNEDIIFEELVWNDFINTIPPNLFNNINNIKLLSNIKNIKYFGDMCFYNSNICIKETLYPKYIGQESFYYAINIKNINCRNIENLKEWAFSFSCFKKINISNYKKELPENLFFRMDYVEEIILPLNTKCIPKASFYNCNCLTKVTNLNKVKVVDDTAFFGCKSMKFPKDFFFNLKYIGDIAFGNTCLPKKIILNNVKLNFGSFCKSFGLEEIEFTDKYSSKSIPKKCFSEIYSLKKVILCKNIKILDEVCFYCSSLNKINLENIREFRKSCLAHTEIHYAKLNNAKFTKKTFDVPFNNSNIKKIDLSENDTLCINEGAFERCFQLEKIIFPKKLKKIETHAFKDTNLKNVKLPNTLKEIGEGIFKDAPLKVLRIPNSVTKISRFAFQWLSCSIIFQKDFVLTNKMIDDGIFCSFYGNIDYSKCILQDKNYINEYLKSKNYTNVFDLKSAYPFWHIKIDKKQIIK